MRRRRCAGCGEMIDGYPATIWQGDKRSDYHHDDDRSCYGTAVTVMASEDFDALLGWLDDPELHDLPFKQGGAS